VHSGGAVVIVQHATQASASLDWSRSPNMRPKATDMPDLLKRWESRAQALYPGWPVRSAVQAGDYDAAGYLAHFVCIGYFTASESRDPEMSGSAMVLVWYQDKCPVEGVTLPPIAESECRSRGVAIFHAKDHRRLAKFRGAGLLTTGWACPFGSPKKIRSAAQSVNRRTSRAESRASGSICVA
jgi:hypothetical protein